MQVLYHLLLFLYRVSQRILGAGDTRLRLVFNRRSDTTENLIPCIVYSAAREMAYSRPQSRAAATPQKDYFETSGLPLRVQIRRVPQAASVEEYCAGVSAGLR